MSAVITTFAYLKDPMLNLIDLILLPALSVNLVLSGSFNLLMTVLKYIWMNPLGFLYPNRGLHSINGNGLRLHALCSLVAQGCGGKTEAAGRGRATADREHPEATQRASTGCNRALPKSPPAPFSETQTM